MPCRPHPPSSDEAAAPLAASTPAVERDATNYQAGAADDAPPFFTTSDLLSAVNAALEADAADDGDNSDSAKTTEGRQRPAFELHKRLPDGSTVPADDTDVAAADFQSKLKQAAAEASRLDPQEKREWMERQRQRGNALFRREEYRDAMDVYLTCFVGMEGAPPGVGGGDRTNGGEIAANSETTTTDGVTGDVGDLLLPVLLNLSLCALRIGTPSKAERFCDFALSTPVGRVSPKAYFLRGRARLLRGKHDAARADLSQALELLGENSRYRNVRATAEIENEKDAVQREICKLEGLEREAERNRRKHSRAMRLALGGKAASSGGGVSHGEDDTVTAIKTAANEEVGNNDGIYQDVRQKRTYSTLRALPSETSVSPNSGGRIERGQGKEEHRPTYFQWCLSILERCLRQTLRALGDEDEDYDDSPIAKKAR